MELIFIIPIDKILKFVSHSCPNIERRLGCFSEKIYFEIKFYN